MVEKTDYAEKRWKYAFFPQTLKLFMNELYNNFDAGEAKNAAVKWIRNFFEQNGPDCKAVIGISGGKDSTVVAALCVEALGKERVLGVQMPNGTQNDIDVADAVIEYLGIPSVECNILSAVTGVEDALFKANIEMSIEAETNLPPRIRMSMLYAVSQSVKGRVSCNSNASEYYCGYFTRGGDNSADFAPIISFTTDEVVAIGYELGLPKEFIEKIPQDGLCGKTDEDNLGFSYAVLNKYIRTGVCEDAEIKAKIDYMHKSSMFKRLPIASFVHSFNDGPPFDL